MLHKRPKKYRYNTCLFFSTYFNSLKPNSKASTKGIMNGKKNKKYKNTFLLII